MATRFDDPEDWENIEPHDLGSIEPQSVARVRNLLEAARGYPGENRESPRKKKALALLSGLVMPMIRNRCRFGIRGIHRDEAEMVANMVFESHACGYPFLADGPYRTWAESWRPERGPFIVFVSVCADSRCLDWLRSENRERVPDLAGSLEALGTNRHQISATMPEAGMTPEQAAEQDEGFEALHLALADMAPGRATDAICARIYEGLTAAEYADREGISARAASMRMKRGADELARRLRERGVLSEKFALSRASDAQSEGREVLPKRHGSSSN